jgi:hypothetical protein
MDEDEFYGSDEEDYDSLLEWIKSHEEDDIEEEEED